MYSIVLGLLVRWEIALLPITIPPIINTHLLSEAGTTGHSTKGLSLPALLLLVQ